MVTFLIAAAALQPAMAPAPQQLAPMTCTAQPNFVTRERLPIDGENFRFSGMMTANSLQSEDFTPFASFALLQAGRPEELSAVMSVQPATQRRYDVTLRRLINNELRERSVIGRVRSGPVPFEISVTGGREIVFKVGNIVERVPLDGFEPDAIVLGCSSGSFRFDNLVFNGAVS